MVINTFSVAFFCNGGTTNFDVAWNVSGDPAGQVDIYRNYITGSSFVQIAADVSFVSSLVDVPPGNGSYQYWLIANNSDFADETAIRNLGTVNTSCVD